ncbi:hypothetical protein [Sphaerisporangium flaviroseum]|uniref:hypothetical protein n=1 Tax=Sphaerisporangium flaviroseum TaxID=509199 RepID=UPI0031E89105
MIAPVGAAPGESHEQDLVQVMAFHEVGRRATRAELGNELSFSARLGGVRRRPIDLVRPFHALF